MVVKVLQEKYSFVCQDSLFSPFNGGLDKRANDEVDRENGLKGA